ncbi:hypothetical protein C8R44DRAFT_726727 [Mycena epipterygia]|nr:hypothetical protein C8R44DRAFT_726727 [Mycena epipterygia]
MPLRLWPLTVAVPLNTWARACCDGRKQADLSTVTDTYDEIDKPSLPIDPRIHIGHSATLDSKLGVGDLCVLYVPTSESPAPSIHRHVAVRRTPVHIPHWGTRHQGFLNFNAWRGVDTTSAGACPQCGGCRAHEQSLASAGAGDLRMHGGSCVCGTWRCWIWLRRTSSKEELVDTEMEAEADTVGSGQELNWLTAAKEGTDERVLGAQDTAAHTEVSRNREGTGRDRQAEVESGMGKGPGGGCELIGVGACEKRRFGVDICSYALSWLPDTVAWVVPIHETRIAAEWATASQTQTASHYTSNLSTSSFGWLDTAPTPSPDHLRALLRSCTARNSHSQLALATILASNYILKIHIHLMRGWPKIQHVAWVGHCVLAAGRVAGMPCVPSGFVHTAHCRGVRIFLVDDAPIKSAQWCTICDPAVPSWCCSLGLTLSRVMRRFRESARMQGPSPQAPLVPSGLTEPSFGEREWTSLTREKDWITGFKEEDLNAAEQG